MLTNAAPMSSSFSIATATASSFVSTATLPRLPLFLAAASSTALYQNQEEEPSVNNVDGPQHSEMRSSNPSSRTTTGWLTPRARSCLWMAIAMSLHFGGYEFARSGALALFTSSDTGFSHPSAYPFAIGLVTPVSLVLLYWYGLLLKANGPRYALRTTKLMSVSILLLSTLALKLIGEDSIFSKTMVAILFVFQNSYAHLIYTQQWSFLGSVMTPTEGTKWFSPIAGICSLVCTMTATLVHRLAASVGLLGLILGTVGTLSMSLLLADRAYQLGELNGFDPSETMRASKEAIGAEAPKSQEDERSLIVKIIFLFQKVPTLAALFTETISFQSLSTVLNICFVRQLKEQVPFDTDRASFTGRLYACINGVAALMQFFVLPLARKFMEPKWVYRSMPLVLMPFLVYAALQTTSLRIAAMVFFALKTMDYSLRNIVNEMVYQPLDFDSRYLGKETIGVFANRFGKSGMSILLSLLAPMGIGVTQLSHIAAAVGSLWSASSVWLSRLLVSNAEAERLVQKRNKKLDDAMKQE